MNSFIPCRMCGQPLTEDECTCGNYVTSLIAERGLLESAALRKGGPNAILASPIGSDRPPDFSGPIGNDDRGFYIGLTWESNIISDAQRITNDLIPPGGLLGVLTAFYTPIWRRSLRWVPIGSDRPVETAGVSEANKDRVFTRYVPIGSDRPRGRVGLPETLPLDPPDAGPSGPLGRLDGAAACVSDTPGVDPSSLEERGEISGLSEMTWSRKRVGVWAAVAIAAGPPAVYGIVMGLTWLMGRM